MVSKSNAMRKSAKTKEEELRGIEQELQEKLTEIANSYRTVSVGTAVLVTE